MSKNRQKSDAYSKAYESGFWDDPETGEVRWEAFFAAFEADLVAAPLELKTTAMRRYGIWFGPQR